MTKKVGNVFISDKTQAEGYTTICYFYMEEAIEKYRKSGFLGRAFASRVNRARGLEISEQMKHYLDRSGFEEGKDYRKINLCHYSDSQDLFAKWTCFEVVCTDAVQDSLKHAKFDGLSEADCPNIVTDWNEMVRVSLPDVDIEAAAIEYAARQP